LNRKDQGGLTQEDKEKGKKDSHESCARGRERKTETNVLWAQGKSGKEGVFGAKGKSLMEKTVVDMYLQREGKKGVFSGLKKENAEVMSPRSDSGGGAKKGKGVQLKGAGRGRG